LSYYVQLNFLVISGNLKVFQGIVYQYFAVVPKIDRLTVQFDGHRLSDHIFRLYIEKDRITYPSLLDTVVIFIR